VRGASWHDPVPGVKQRARARGRHEPAAERQCRPEAALRPHTLADLGRTPNTLAAHYKEFRVAHRLLLTGHSHQAWPNAGFVAQQEAWRDAARYVDDKWEHAFAGVERVRRGFAELLEDERDDITLAANTHELLVRFLSALPLREWPRLVTTDAEFHTIRRQLDRLAEACARRPTAACARS
jgi:kynureninase